MCFNAWNCLVAVSLHSPNWQVPVSCFWNWNRAVQQSTRQTHRRRTLNQRCLFLYSVFVPLDSRQWQWAVFTYSWRIVQTCVNYWATTLHSSAQYCDYMMNVCLFYSLCPVVEMNFPIPHVKTDINIDLNNLVWIESRLEISLYRVVHRKIWQMF